VDGNFIASRHPACDNAWLLGGGSGHGFKLGPALGESMSQLVQGKGKPEPMFQVERISKSPKDISERPRK